MGFWDVMNAPTTLTANSTRTPYVIYQQYFSPYTVGGKTYSYRTFRDDVREARNLGLNISHSQAHAMRLLAKHDLDWFNEDGTLKEGLSSRQAKKAKKYKAEANSLYNRIKPKLKAKKASSSSTSNSEKALAKWAYNNFVARGYDTSAADYYSRMSSYNDIANLWGGNNTVKQGGVYGDAALLAEQAYFNSLSAPQKRAYLAQRELWVNNKVLNPAEGKALAVLAPVTTQDMLQYVRDNINNWLYSFYGDDGYADEYAIANPTVDENTKKMYQLYGIAPAASSAAIWTPASVVKTSGFTVNKPAVKKDKQAEKTDKNTAVKKDKQAEKTDKNTDAKDLGKEPKTTNSGGRGKLIK